MDGLILPVGADLTALNQAFASISGHAVRMGAKINSSMTATQSGFARMNANAVNSGGAFSRMFRGFESGGRTAFAGVGKAGRAAFASISSSMSLLGVAGGVGGIGAALAVGMKSISKAAEMEGLETAFAPLLGGADQAKARIQELSRFAASTPFELPEVARASRVLETLTKGALSTGAGLTLVGDVAATTQAPFAEIATTIGRLYDGLQSGRPVGEAMARLQELGAVSGDVRTRIEELQKSGAAGNDVWQVAAVALSRFSGAMEAQSQTWNGKLSTFKDNVSLAMAAFGEPIMDSLKPYMDSASKMAAKLGKSAADFGKKVAESIRFISAAFASGQVGALLGTSLKLGFVNATNFLWRSLNGVFGAAGQYLIEYAKTAVSMFQILTKADFWKGMGNALIGVFLDSIAFFQKGLAAALEAVRPLAEILGQGDKVTSAKSTLNESAGILREEAGGYYGKAGDQLAPMMEQITERLRTGIANVADRFSEAFANAGDLIDPSAIQEEIRGLMGLITETMEKSKVQLSGAQAKLKAGKEGEDEGKKDSLMSKVKNAIEPQVMSLTRIGGGGVSSGGGKGSALGGQMSARSGGSVAAVVSTLSVVRGIARDVKQIAKNTTPTPDARPMAARYS